MQLEVEELAGDLLAGLAREQLLVLEHGRVDALEAERARDRAEVLEQPVAEAQVLGVEVARSARRLEGRSALLAHGAFHTTGPPHPPFC